MTVPPSPWRLGLDLGSTAAKAVLLDPDDRVHWRHVQPTHMDPARAARELAAAARAAAPPDAVLKTLATGYGRALAAADRRATEIACHAAGARRLRPDILGVVDLGGQDAKAIRLGPNGAVLDFAMNDRCAAGTGRFLEVMTARFGWSLADLAVLPPPPTEAEIAVNATCVVFAESELVGLAARGKSPAVLLAGVLRAVARRVGALARKVDLAGPAAFTGGGAALESLRLMLAGELEIELVAAPDPQFVGALGAATLLGKARPANNK